MANHTIIYVPGLGDYDRGRRLTTAFWRIYGVQPTIQTMAWSDKQPFAIKLQSLLGHIDTLVEQGRKVSLVGESAGASAALAAYAARQDVIHRVVFICGKLRAPETLHPATYTHNPAFAESMAMVPENLLALSPEKLARIRSIHPLTDHIVPVQDTLVTGADNVGIPTNGHFMSIVLGTTVFSWKIVGFLRRP